MALPRRSAGPMAPASSSGYADVSELDNYQLISNIGKGSFGVISKVKRKEDGREYALKELDYSKMTEKDRKQILAEVAILESLKHRNIVQLVQKIKDPKNERIYIVMEYCTSGDLGTIIRRASRAGQPLHEDKIWNVFLQITLALHHCHCPASRPVGKGRPSGSQDASKSQVLHRDLKPENVFMSDDFVKLGDFGLSKSMGSADFTSTYVGTPLYMPPEILAENRYDTSSDIWSLGCLVYEMCTLSSPFAAAQTQAELIQMVKAGKMPPVPVAYSPQLRSIIRAMMSLNPRSRPSTQQLLDMPEMQLHKKAFTVQNQMAMVASRGERLRVLEERLLAKAASLDEREKALMGREAHIAAREAACVAKEGENLETQAKLNTAAEQLRSHWDKLRLEKERMSDVATVLEEERPAIRRTSTVPMAMAIRPNLEERTTMPVPAASRLTRHPAWEDTPSKIPVAVATASPVPLERLPLVAQATPLRRANTKSLGNIHAAYTKEEATPAKQTIPQHGRQRTSIGSPSELYYNEDVTMASMASPAVSAFASPAPFIPRPRRSSIAPSGALSTHSSGSLASGSSSDSISANEQENIPPTMIPAPKAFVYREAATPAKWAVEDPDLPSPFLRRLPTAPPAMQTERQPLGGISLQAAPHAAASSAPTSSRPTGISGITGLPTATSTATGVKKSSMPAIPRSRSGNLHQHVLRANAHARTSGEGVRARPGTAATPAARTYG